jgi:ERCC4-type nuclease
VVVATEPVCRIRVDLFERRSGVPDALRELGVEVSLEHLEVGDYDLGGGAMVERKTLRDLRHALRRGRLWRQLGCLRAACDWPYLLIEGDGDEWTNGFRGACLAAMGQGIPVIISDSPTESAAWLRLAALRIAHSRLGRDRPVYAQRLKPHKEQVREAMLSAVPGISVARARALLERFGSVERVVTAEPEEWLTVPGIGPVVTTALHEAIS